MKWVKNVLRIYSSETLENFSDRCLWWSSCLVSVYKRAYQRVRKSTFRSNSPEVFFRRIVQ